MKTSEVIERLKLIRAAPGSTPFLARADKDALAIAIEILKRLEEPKRLPLPENIAGALTKGSGI